MRYRTLTVFCLCGLLVTRVSAQEFTNRATLEINRLELTAMIDKFAYAPGEPITAVFKVLNHYATPIAVDASRTCSRIGRLEWWCAESRSYCFGLHDPRGEERCSEQVEFPHGETILQTKVFKAFDFGSGQTPTSGQIEFVDPWGEPPSYSIILEYENPGALALEKATWGLVKQLYKR